MPPQYNKPFKLYLSVNEQAIGSALMQCKSLKEKNESCICEQKTLGRRNKIFHSGKVMFMLIFLMHKVETLSINC
jgi:hypothetical protein